MVELVTGDVVATPAERVRGSLARLQLAAIRHRGMVGSRLRVSDEELTVLLYLAEHRGVTQARLAALTTLSRSGTGALVQRLELADLVERHPVPGDRRLRLVGLSERGARLVRDAYSDLTADLERLLADVSGPELGACERFLAGLADAIETVAGEPPAPAVAPSAAADPIWRRWG